MENASTLAVDKDFVTIAGSSSGGNTVGLYGTAMTIKAN